MGLTRKNTNKLLLPTIFRNVVLPQKWLGFKIGDKLAVWILIFLVYFHFRLPSKAVCHWYPDHVTSTLSYYLDEMCTIFNQIRLWKFLIKLSNLLQRYNLYMDGLLCSAISCTNCCSCCIERAPHSTSSRFIFSSSSSSSELIIYFRSNVMLLLKYILQ